MYGIIGYHNILYVRSCMKLLVIIIYYQGCMGTCTHTPGTCTHIPKYRVHVSQKLGTWWRAS